MPHSLRLQFCLVFAPLLIPRLGLGLWPNPVFGDFWPWFDSLDVKTVWTIGNCSAYYLKIWVCQILTYVSPGVSWFFSEFLYCWLSFLGSNWAHTIYEQFESPTFLINHSYLYWQSSHFKELQILFFFCKKNIDPHTRRFKDRPEVSHWWDQEESFKSLTQSCMIPQN